MNLRDLGASCDVRVGNMLQGKLDGCIADNEGQFVACEEGA